MHSNSSNICITEPYVRNFNCSFNDDHHGTSVYSFFFADSLLSQQNSLTNMKVWVPLGSCRTVLVSWLLKITLPFQELFVPPPLTFCLRDRWMVDSILFLFFCWWRLEASTGTQNKGKGLYVYKRCKWEGCTTFKQMDGDEWHGYRMEKEKYQEQKCKWWWDITKFWICKTERVIEGYKRLKLTICGHCLASTSKHGTTASA